MKYQSRLYILQEILTFCHAAKFQSTNAKTSDVRRVLLHWRLKDPLTTLGHYTLQEMHITLKHCCILLVVTREAIRLIKLATKLYVVKYLEQFFLMMWKHVLQYWPFVWIIHQSLFPLLWSITTAEQTVEVASDLDAIMLMWQHSNLSPIWLKWKWILAACRKAFKNETT